MFWTILFYAVCAVGALLFVGLLYYRIDWARHPEKYKDLENDEKSEYWEKKKKDQQLREKKAKDKAKALKQQRRLDKVNHYRAVAGKKPLDQNLKEKKKRKSPPCKTEGFFVIKGHREPEGAELVRCF